MTNSPNNETNKVSDTFSMLLTPAELNNKRTAVRYIRTDITVSLRLHGFFNFNKYYPAELLDISSKGVAIKCKKAISIQKKVTVSLVFKDNTIFKIPAKIVYKNNDKQQYGIKFDRFNNKLGDYLVSSEHDLIFK